jgi:hypothetical protein
MEGGFAVALQAMLCKVEVSIGLNVKQQGVSELIHSENLLVGMHKVYYLILQVVSFGFDVWHLCVHNENLAPMHASHPASLLLHGLL